MDRADSSRRAYTSYVLHVWRANERLSRRATLHVTATGQRYSFASLEALFAFLDAQFDSTEHADACDGAVLPPEPPRE